MRARRGLLALAVVGTLGLAACGGSGDKGGLTDSAQSGTESDAGADSAADEGNGTPQTVGNVAGLSGACEATINLISVTGQILAGQIPAASARETLERFVKEAPSEIKADAEIFAGAYLEWVEVLARYNGDVAKAYEEPEVVAVLEKLQGADTSGAYDRIGKYVTEECDGLG